MCGTQQCAHAQDGALTGAGVESVDGPRELILIVAPVHYRIFNAARERNGHVTGELVALLRGDRGRLECLAHVAIHIPSREQR